MNWLSVLGLAIDAIGATIVLAPGLPVLMRVLDHFWRFKQIEAAKIKLYRQGCLDRNGPGFEQVARAIEQAGGWTKLPGEQLEKDAKTELRVGLMVKSITLRRKDTIYSKLSALMTPLGIKRLMSLKEGRQSH